MRLHEQNQHLDTDNTLLVHQAPTPELEEKLDTLTTLMVGQQQLLATQQAKTNAPKNRPREIQCHNCKGPHLIRNCPLINTAQAPQYGYSQQPQRYAQPAPPQMPGSYNYVQQQIPRYNTRPNEPYHSIQQIQPNQMDYNQSTVNNNIANSNASYYCSYHGPGSHSSSRCRVLKAQSTQESGNAQSRGATYNSPPRMNRTQNPTPDQLVAQQSNQ